MSKKGFGSWSWNKSRGRRDGSSGTSISSKRGAGRERNVSHRRSEEHNRRAKGNRGGFFR